MASSSYWSIIRPEATTNLITNPSFETNTTGWSTGGTNSIAQTSDQSLFGIYSLECTYGNSLDLATYAITFSAAGTYYFTIYAYLSSDYVGGYVSLAVSDFTGGSITTTSQLSTVSTWTRLEGSITVVSGDLTGTLRVTANSAITAGLVYLDGAQIENKAYATTYCDGDQDGCSWAGTVHASKSTRDALSASGGRVLNLADDLGFIPNEQDGTGMARVNNLASPQALQVGERFEGQTIQGRSFTISGSIVGTTVANFHSQKSDLISALSPNTVKINERSMPRLMRYSGATIEKEITAVYDGGLENGLPQGWTAVDYRLRLLAHDPLFYQLGESSTVLDSNDNATFSYIAHRTSAGTWDNMTHSGGTVSSVNALAEDDTYIYVGGNFTNWNGIANADYIVRWNKETETWSALGTGFNASCLVITIAPDGTVYAGGTFTTAGGGGANYIASWDGSSWSALGTGLNASSRDIAISDTGTLYVTGSFTTAGGTTVNGIAQWDGSTWAVVGTGTGLAGGGTEGFAIALFNTDLYLGGNFISVDGVSTNYIAKWNGSNWTALSTGMDNVVYSLYIDANENLYVGGNFTTAGGGAAAKIAKWNGLAWSALSTGLNDIAYALVFYDGNLYAGGSFTGAGGTTLSDGLAIWNGSTWAHSDIDLPNASTVNALVVSSTGLYAGFDTTGTTYYAGSTTITYTGTERAYPIIKIKRTGGTSAKIQSLRNETTGAVLYFDYALLDGETLTIDTRPNKQSMTSSFRGNVYGDLLPNSDFGSFYLLHGNSGSQDNVITCFVNEVGSPTVTATAQWRNAYVSED